MDGIICRLMLNFTFYTFKRERHEKDSQENRMGKSNWLRRKKWIMLTMKEGVKRKESKHGPLLWDGWALYNGESAS